MLVKYKEEQNSVALTENKRSTVLVKTPPLNDKRRQHQLQSSSYYERLSLAQKISTAELAQYGYELKYIRGQGTNSFAIFVLEEQIATVDFLGDIHLNPKIKIRE